MLVSPASQSLRRWRLATMLGLLLIVGNVRAHHLADVRQVLGNEVLVGAQQTGQMHLRVVDLDLVALANQLLGQCDQRALPQVVGTCLEGQADEADLAFAGPGDAR